MTIWRWVFKIALQLIPVLIGIDWNRPRRNEPLIKRDYYQPLNKPRRRYKRRRFFD